MWAPQSTLLFQVKTPIWRLKSRQTGAVSTRDLAIICIRQEERVRNAAVRFPAGRRTDHLGRFSESLVLQSGLKHPPSNSKRKVEADRFAVVGLEDRVALPCACC